jgi:integrase
MTIFLRGTSWYYEFQLRGVRHVKALGPITKTQAKREEQLARAKALEGTLAAQAPRSSPRFATFAHEYLPWYASSRRPSSARRYRDALKPLVAFFGPERLAHLSLLSVERYKQYRLAQGVSPVTVNAELKTLRHMYSTALAWGKLTTNPLATLKRYRTAIRHMRTLSMDEEARLLAACSNTVRPLVLVALYAGLRRGELLALRWGHVDLAHRLVTVDAATAKSGKTRSIPLNATALAAFQGLYTGQTRDEPVFLNFYGQPLYDPNWGLRQAISRSGIAPCRLHDLRHTFASRLVQAGADLRSVQELMGHASLRDTERYLHLQPGQTRTAVALLDSHQKSQQQKSPRKIKG